MCERGGFRENGDGFGTFKGWNGRGKSLKETCEGLAVDLS